MKKLLVFLLLIFATLSLLGCTESSVPSGWPNPIPQISPPSNDYSCDQTDTDSVLSKASYFLIDPIVTQVQAVSVIIYGTIVTNTVYMQIIRTMLILYIVIYGIMFTYGLVPIKLSDLMVRIVKIGVVLTLMTETSYKFFNDNLFRLFTDGSYQLLTIVTNPYCDSGTDEVNFFSFFNYVIDTFFSKDIFFRLVGLALSFPIGWICFWVLLVLMVKYLFAVIKAIIAYLFAFTAIALLIALAPIFIALILFDKTWGLFDKWVKTLAMFALQPAILFTGIFFISLFVNDIIQSVFVELQWAEIIPVYIDFGSGNKISLFGINWYVPPFVYHFNHDDFLNFFASLIVLYLCVDLLGKLPSYVQSIAFALVGGSGAGIGEDSASAKIVTGAGEKVKGLVGMDKDSVQRRKKWDESAGKKR